MDEQQTSDVWRRLSQARRERQSIAEELAHDLTGEHHQPGALYLVYDHSSESVYPELIDACEEPVQLLETLQQLQGDGLSRLEIVRVQMPGGRDA